MARTIAMMQPYLFPYLGYFQLINTADVFVLGDDLQYIRSGWVNRNRILANGEAKLITFPLKKDRFELPINQRQLSDTFDAEAERLIRQIEATYRKAPCFAEVMPLIERLIRFPERNIAVYTEHAVRQICAYLKITTPIVLGSVLKLGTPTDKQDRVIRIAKIFASTTFINPEGGSVLYDRERFATHGLDVHFFRMGPVTYPQFKQPFVAKLSIIDVLMFNSVEQIQPMLDCYTLEEGDEPEKEDHLFQMASQRNAAERPVLTRIAVE